jgi:plastocyanin
MEGSMVNRFVTLSGSLIILLVSLLFLRQDFHTHFNHDPLLSPPRQPSQASAQTTTIEFGGALGFAYSPKDIRISPGDSVEWLGDFSMHSLVSEQGLWQMVSTGSDFTFTFNQPGTYKFHCFFHNSVGMNGTVTVGYYAYLPLAIR